MRVSVPKQYQIEGPLERSFNELFQAPYFNGTEILFEKTYILENEFYLMNWPLFFSCNSNK